MLFIAHSCHNHRTGVSRKCQMTLGNTEEKQQQKKTHCYLLGQYFIGGGNKEAKWRIINLQWRNAEVLQGGMLGTEWICSDLASDFLR